MWTASQMKETNTAQPSVAAVGVVTASGTENGVLLGSERRWLPVMAPGGYRWSPRAGETVLVLKAGNDGEAPCILAGQMQEKNPLQPGEVELVGPGCSLTLTQGGEVAVQGTMMINGKPLEEIVRSMVAAAMAGQGG